MAKLAAYHIHNYNSWTERRPSQAEAKIWHLRLGHPGPEPLEQLVKGVNGAKIKGIPTRKCDACAQAKMERQPRRQPRDLSGYSPDERLAIDFHDFQQDKEGYSSLFLITDRVSRAMWDYYLQDRTSASIATALRNLIDLLERQYGVTVKVIKCDNEIEMKRRAVNRFLNKVGIKAEPSAPYTQAQNGAAERSGGVLKERINAMGRSANLPEALWREICKAAVYLLNRTPRSSLGWKTPWEAFHDSLGRGAKRHDVAHLRVYGCKTYVMTPEAMNKENRLKRFNPKAWIGYLVGYVSSNIYRIWVPHQNKVISARDVIFDEDAVFDGNLGTMKDDVKEMSLDEIADLLRKAEVQDGHVPLKVDQQQEDTNVTLDDDDWSDEDELSAASGKLEELASGKGKAVTQLSTPPASPPDALMAAAMFGSTVIADHHLTTMP
ncbi:hypothetical protein VTN31DRAFT_2709 [Thermomyces dupontii]|uniref:uncharacterized protein n=1 Tax=Talaromyces thermophilus TaxID=28565 RepID=UPI003743437A